MDDKTLISSFFFFLRLFLFYLNSDGKFEHDVFAKSPIRSLPVCDFDFVDASGEIRLVAFRDECTRFHSIIEIDKVKLLFFFFFGQFKFVNSIYFILFYFCSI